MSKRTVMVLALVALIGALYFLFGRGGESCSVCLSYRGRTGCATASAGTAAAAVETAQRRACAKIVAADSLASCLAVPPASVQCKS